MKLVEAMIYAKRGMEIIKEIKKFFDARKKNEQNKNAGKIKKGIHNKSRYNALCK